MITRERLDKLYAGQPWNGGNSLEDLRITCNSMACELTIIMTQEDQKAYDIANDLLPLLQDMDLLLPALRKAYVDVGDSDNITASYLAIIGADLGDAHLILKSATHATQMYKTTPQAMAMVIGFVNIATGPQYYCAEAYRDYAMDMGRRILRKSGLTEDATVTDWDNPLAVESGEGAGPGIVVVSSLGGGVGTTAREIERDFKKILKKCVPLSLTPPITEAFSDLVAEAPHLRAVIDTLLRDMAGSDAIRIRPTILVGEPGCGKTRLARRLGEVLDMPYRVIPCGGVHDAAFGGTSRQWHSGRPCVPLGVIRDTQIANPLIILDEIEKAGTTRHNGSIFDILLGMLETENAIKYWDLYTESHVDLSRVNWLMTANSLTGLHPALRDRCRILHVPDPGPEHLLAILPGLLDDVMSERGLGHEWRPVIGPADMGLIAETWGGGSVRKLRRVVEAYLDACDGALAH